MASENGIKFRAKLPGLTGWSAGSTPFSSTGIGSGDAIIEWFRAPNGECLGGKSPSLLLENWYGDLTTAADTNYAGLARVYTSDDSILGAGKYLTSVADYTVQEYNAWAEMATIAILISATVTNLPPISIDSDAQIAGFLDYNKMWGLDYDVDVEHMNWEESWIGDLDIDFASAAAEGAGTDIAMDAWTSSMLSEEGLWRTIQPMDLDESNSTWPNGRLDTFWELSPGARLTQFEQFGYATTVVMEALGFDAIDSKTVTTGVSTDANEALHSNEVVRHVSSGPGVDWDFMNDPSISSHNDLGGTYELTWKNTWQTRAGMAKRYHALYDSSDPATTGTGGFSFSSVRGVRRNEESELARNIDGACRLIGPELEVISLPKRLINHVQKRRKIPDNMVSAFGYVAEDMYDPTAAAEEMGDTTADVITNYVVEGTEMGVLEEGESGATGRGASEGSWDESTGTWIPHEEIY